MVSTGTCLFPKKAKCLFHKISISRTGFTPVVFCPALAIPLLSSCYAYLSLPLVISRLLKKRNISGVIIYNFSPLLFLIAVWLKTIRKIPLFQNVEDVSVPQIKDWLPATEARPMQQIIFYVCMKLIAHLSNGFILPSKNFLQYLFPKPTLHVTGCIEKVSIPILENQGNQHVNLLFAGKISKEHGIDIFLEALYLILQNRELCKKVRVRICGSGNDSDWLQAQLAKLSPSLDCKYLGFITDKEYLDLLHQIDICVALQHPQGRHATYKTPSKVYEYLGNAKAVIATKVGDLSDIPEDVISTCDPFTGEYLAKQLETLIKNPNLLDKRKENAGLYAFNNFSYDKVGKKIQKFINDYS